MRILLLTIALALPLSGCSTVRSGFGALSDLISSNETNKRDLSDSDAVDTATSTAHGIPATNIASAYKQVPHTLKGDTENSAHTGDPIPPQ